MFEGESNTTLKVFWEAGNGNIPQSSFCRHGSLMVGPREDRDWGFLTVCVLWDPEGILIPTRSCPQLSSKLKVLKGDLGSRSSKSSLELKNPLTMKNT